MYRNKQLLDTHTQGANTAIADVVSLNIRDKHLQLKLLRVITVAEALDVYVKLHNVRDYRNYTI